ncbi:flagellar hook-length control protein FliK [Paracoccus zhejiangensis]|nr:flagellar hook-length control protein FliK [Paracoccus zhejiangensis]
MENVMNPATTFLPQGGARPEGTGLPIEAGAGTGAGFEALMAGDQVRLPGQPVLLPEGSDGSNAAVPDLRNAEPEPVLLSVDESASADDELMTGAGTDEALLVEEADEGYAVLQGDAPVEDPVRDARDECGVDAPGLPLAVNVHSPQAPQPQEAAAAQRPGPALVARPVQAGTEGPTAYTAGTLGEAKTDAPDPSPAAIEPRAVASGADQPVRRETVPVAIPLPDAGSPGAREIEPSITPSVSSGLARPVLAEGRLLAFPPTLQPLFPGQVPTGGDTSGAFDLLERMGALPPFVLTAAAEASHPVAHGIGPIPVSAETLCRQVGEAALRMQDDRIEIALSPEELGSVRLVLSRGEAGAALTVWVERPEVLEMLRRHADLLMGDLRNSGLGEASLSFRDGTGGQSGSGAYSAPGGPWAANMRNADAVGINAGDRLSSRGQRSLADGGRLDIRV